MYVYFLTMRPPSIGTHPKDGIKTVESFGFRKLIKVNDETIKAWGWVGYEKPLTRKTAENYEMIGEIYAD